ncbi:MAG: uracil-DNA glycosylase family protein [Alphaproteobacteria bacterium]
MLLRRGEVLALLEWQIAMGADEAIGDVARDRFAPAPAERPVQALAGHAPVNPPPDPTPLNPLPDPLPHAGEERLGVPALQSGENRATNAASARSPANESGPVAPVVVTPPAALAESPAEAAQSARLLAGEAQTIEALAELVAGFDLCPLKRTATNTVFMDGNPAARIVIVGEAPGAEEDRTGRPFVGRAGQLLDRMLAAIGLDRAQVQITNVIYWRPPGNRKPTAAETAACLPFVLRHIALARPRVLVLAGGTAANTLLPVTDGITRLRGRWFDLVVPGLDAPVPTLPMFHPAFLLRTPERKREAWRDLLALKARLNESAAMAP